MHCEQAETFLAALIYGQLDSKPKAALLEHLATCMKCSSLLAGMRSVSGLLKEAVEAGQPPKLSRRRRAVLLRAAARSQEQKHVASTKMSAILEKIKSIFPTLTGPMRFRHLGGIAAVLVLAVVGVWSMMPSLLRARQTKCVANQVDLGQALRGYFSTARQAEPTTDVGEHRPLYSYTTGGDSAGEETEIATTTDTSGSMREGKANAPQGPAPSETARWELDFVGADDVDGRGGGGTAAESLAPGRV
ncbi:MAG: zf-HC2 domain-containing protein, partial [Planctomycetes bacterium]|nr:zf-HC2 domain-containing protein [Planctomycetota bacterium]